MRDKRKTKTKEDPAADLFKISQLLGYTVAERPL